MRPWDCQIFAYGSSMNREVMLECCPGAKFLSIANLPDHELCFPRWSEDRNTFIVGYRPAADKKLWGVVWLVPIEERDCLDRDKGVGIRYDRVPITVYFPNRNSCVIDTYRVIPGQSGKPARAHLNLIIAGAEHHKLPREYIDDLARQWAG
jgi:hypothetical protein